MQRSWETRAGRWSGKRRRRAVQTDAGEPVQTNQDDQSPDLRLSVTQHQDAASPPQTPREHGQIQHQRGVGKGQLAEINHQVALRTERACQRATAEALGGPVLVAGTSQDWGIVRELDDSGNL